MTDQADDRNLLSLEELRDAVGSDLTEPQLETLGARVSAAITRACRVPADGAIPPTLRLEAVTDTFRFKSRQHSLLLSRIPIVSVTSITENDEVLDEDDYEIHASSGLLKRLSGECEIHWPCGKIVVAYQAGWAEVPDDLKAIAAELAQSYVAESQNADPNLRSEEIPGVISRTWWVDNTNTSPIPDKLMNALAQGGYIQFIVG